VPVRSLSESRGRVAQLGERCVRNAEVGSSILPASTNPRSITRRLPAVAFRARRWAAPREQATAARPTTRQMNADAASTSEAVCISSIRAGAVNVGGQQPPHYTHRHGQPGSLVEAPAGRRQPALQRVRRRVRAVGRLRLAAAPPAGRRCVVRRAALWRMSLEVVPRHAAHAQRPRVPLTALHVLHVARVARRTSDVLHVARCTLVRCT
jgi:hypothetical protein